ncbi:hypothetical protein SFRURICE_012643 [Spodoptera frugiperda]|nr:hypothetical protein SFRURICE_012643 [Spodoptera frugiperda]
MIELVSKCGPITDVQFIPTEKGKYILVLRGYTYSQVGGRFFYCSSKHMGCRARVRLMSGKLVASADEHNHAPPSHARCGNGAFVQLRPRGLSNFTGLASAILPSPITSPTVAALALHALNFPRILPKTDLWKEYTSGKRFSWRCSKRGCPATAVTIDDIGALYNGQRFYKNYMGTDGVVSWICHNKHICNRRIKTLGRQVVATSNKTHSMRCIELELEDGTLGAEFEGRKFQNYLEEDGVVSWICYSKNCNRRIRTQGPYVIEVSDNEHSSSNSDVSECTEEYYFGTSSRGNPVLVLSGQRFKLMKDRGKLRRWICIKTRERCNSFVVTEDENIIKMNVHHTH